MLNNLLDVDAIINFLKENDSKENRKLLLTTDELRYYYCFDVKDRKAVWSKITDSRWAYTYCLCVKDRKEVWERITEDEYIYYYCRDIKDRGEMWPKITDSHWVLRYCYTVYSRPELKLYFSRPVSDGIQT